MVSESEGVVKYRLDFCRAEAIVEDILPLNCWRSILYGLGGIGQDVSRYEGYGYGNLSQRCEQDKTCFIISGTQTGNLADLKNKHYVCVEHCDIAGNTVKASGPLKPSSEALTHSMFYQLEADVQCVIHVHSPELWQFGLSHGYPYTDKLIEYGTPQMAAEIFRLYQSGDLLKHKTLMMAGHEDGVICFGSSVQQAGLALVTLWVNSLPARVKSDNQ